MKRLLLLSAVLLLAAGTQAQESVQELSKKAGKGFLYKAVNTDDNYTVTYKIPGDKKANEIFYETYSFDNNIKFLKNEQVSEPKQTQDDKPDRIIVGFNASVGGCGMDVLSMKLKFSKYTEQQTWDFKRQGYVTEKTLSTETIKPRNENGKYYGFAAFTNTADQTLFVLAGVDSKINKRGTDFLILSISSTYDISSKPVDISGSQSLVFSTQLKDGDIALVFAPKKGEPDLSAYTYLRYSPAGELKNKVAFKSPSNNLLIVDVAEQEGAVFFCATSTKSKDAYDDVFDDYTASISNPCFTDAHNKADLSWEKKSGEKMENFHLLKFTGGQLDFATTAAISDFKSKFKTAPGDKGADPYKGKKFSVQEFKVTPDGEYLIGGQLNGKTSLGLGNPVKTYEDIVCFHFDKSGQLKAQYGTQKMNNDKKSEIFPMKQTFVLGKDGKSFYWLVIEVKGFKGYASFVDAYNGSATYHPRFFPRIAKFDLQSSSLGNFAVLGNEKFYMTKSFQPIFDKKENSLVFIGSDEDYKKLWVNKYVFQ